MCRRRSTLLNAAERARQMRTKILSILFSNMDVSDDNGVNGFGGIMA